MRHEGLTHEDYRKVVKDWVMQQPPERPYVFSDASSCIVGQFLKEHPDFRKNWEHSTYSMEGPPNVWNSTHSDVYYDPATDRVIHASAALSTSSFIHFDTNFGDVQTAMSRHPLWRDL